jgi:hypothetical protein
MGFDDGGAMSGGGRMGALHGGELLHPADDPR